MFLREKKSIILDIQSSLVRGALVEFKKEGPSVVKRVIAKSIPSSMAPTNSPRIIQKILEVAENVVEEIIKDTSHHGIHSIHYILSSPWIFSELKTVKINYDGDTKITQKTIYEIVQAEIKKISALPDSEPIEQNIFEIRLNGYPVSVYEGRYARTLEVSFATSFGTKRFLNKLHSGIQKIFHIRHHTYHSALLLQYRSFRTIADKHTEYIYMHVHGELTDVIIVKNGLCKHISSFPFGIVTLLRKIAHTTKQGIGSSESLLVLYESDKLNESEKQNAKKVIDPLLNAWSVLCVKSFSNSFDFIHMPRTVFLSTHSHFDLFKEALLFRNDLNFDIISYEKIIEEDGRIVFEKGSTTSPLMKMYTLALSSML